MRRIILFIILLLCCLAPLNNLYGDPDYQLENQIIYLEKNLGSPLYRKRLQAIRELEALPLEADEIIFERYSNCTDQRIKYLLLIVLANRNYEIELTILRDFSVLKDYKDNLLKILRRNPRKSYNLIYYQLFENPDRPDRQPDLENLYINFLEIEVAEVFEKYFIKAKNYRFYEKDFEHLFSFGEPIFDILVKIAHNEPKITKKLEVYTRSGYLRTLAVRLLGLGKKKKYIEAIKQSTHGPYAIQLEREISISLYLLGENKEILEAIKGKLTSAMLGSFLDFKLSQWAIAGDLYLRINENEKATEVFINAAEYLKVHGTEKTFRSQKSSIYTIYFGLAEIYTEKEDFPKVIEILNQLTNFINDSATWELILNDRNLKKFWESENFSKWIEQKRNDIDIIPDGNPGYFFED